MDLRKSFDVDPEGYDKYRPRCCDEMLADMIEYAELAPGKTVLEVGPGTGQATEPILKTGCSYLAIELGENFTEFMTNKFASYDNFQIVNADFENYDFGCDRFDLVYAATAFHWIPEKIGYPKAFDILKSGGTFAILTWAFPESGALDEPQQTQCQEVYKKHYKHFYSELPSTSRLDYEARGKYGFADLERREYRSFREMNADDYVALRRTNSDILELQEPHKSNVLEELRQVILNNGDYVKLNDVWTLYLARKP